MQIVRSIESMRLSCKALRRNAMPETLALVPTMGAIHEGHLSLVRVAKKSCDRVAVSIFVNPLQFAANEDFSKYPRTFEHDCALLEAEGVDLLFAPSAAEMYPPGAQTWVDVPQIGSRLDGASRPGHFQGVATVVAKLFNIVQPDRAFFGQKDAAQVAVLRTMVKDLNFNVEIIVCPTVRDRNGMALSSRNRYLTTDEQRLALSLSHSLHKIKREVAQGQRAVNVLRSTLVQELQAVDGLRLDYAAIVDPETLEPVSHITSNTVVAVAAWVGQTRLIDNTVIGEETIGAIQ